MPRWRNYSNEGKNRQEGQQYGDECVKKDISSSNTISIFSFTVIGTYITCVDLVFYGFYFQSKTTHCYICTASKYLANRHFEGIVRPN